MVIIQAKAAVEIKMGDIVRHSVTDDGANVIEPITAASAQSAVGMALRGIKKDEIIEYQPGGNTKDILTRVQSRFEMEKG